MEYYGVRNKHTKEFLYNNNTGKILFKSPGDAKRMYTGLFMGGRRFSQQNDYEIIQVYIVPVSGKSFEDWLVDRDRFSDRFERILDETGAKSEIELRKWLQAAFRAGVESVSGI